MRRAPYQPQFFNGLPNGHVGVHLKDTWYVSPCRQMVAQMRGHGLSIVRHQNELAFLAPAQDVGIGVPRGGAPGEPIRQTVNDGSRFNNSAR